MINNTPNMNNVSNIDLDCKVNAQDKKVLWSVRSMIDNDQLTPHDQYKNELAELLCDTVSDITTDDLHLHHKPFVHNLHTFPVSLISKTKERVFIGKDNLYKNYQAYVKSYMLHYDNYTKSKNWSVSQDGGVQIGDSPVVMRPQQEVSYDQFISDVKTCLNSCDMLPSVVDENEHFLEVYFFTKTDGWRECDHFDLIKQDLYKSIDTYLNQTKDLNIMFNIDVGNPAYILYNENTNQYVGVGLHDPEFRCLANWFIMPVSDLWYFVPDFKWSDDRWNQITQEQAHEFIKNFWGTDESIYYKPTQKLFNWLISKSHI